MVALDSSLSQETNPRKDGEMRKTNPKNEEERILYPDAHASGLPMVAMERSLG
jgi:hypothetical protein